MLTHVDTRLVDEVRVQDFGTGHSKALVFGSVLIVVQSPAECDQVIKAAAEAKRRMPGNDLTDEPCGYTLPAGGNGSAES
jgi:hypothetical protein